MTSDRGSVFYLCKLSAVDKKFPKYPKLPVLNCEGYEKIEKAPTPSRSRFGNTL
jgi:hypothetical protein